LGRVDTLDNKIKKISMFNELNWFRGVRYRNWFVYNFLLFLRFGVHYNLRYKIAAEYVGSENSVLDVCSGAGDLRKFLPENCVYACVDASPQFAAILSKKNIHCYKINLHKGINGHTPQFDVLAMVGGMCQFRMTSMDMLLEDFKKIARKIVVLEHVAPKEVKEGSLWHKLNNYLIANDYTVPDREFSEKEFNEIMSSHGYRVRSCDAGYRVGYYDVRRP